MAKYQQRPLNPRRDVTIRKGMTDGFSKHDDENDLLTGEVSRKDMERGIDIEEDDYDRS